ncbi:flagellar export protein FliJ [Vampirovibrio chlorellavorus]|uniref:flagellar export protein FliJ n=1 Tax=Vampirovibrio chlorellavorus TaxID=758823 RepID=UPI0026ED3424|nr:flagellar export protein FliJ [Vampirovibrio chlorellavorus]
MARFVYRLQKVFELRERRKKEQEQRVLDAQKYVREVEMAIEEKKDEIRDVQKNMLASPHTLMAAHDSFLHHLNGQLDQLHGDLNYAQSELEYERQLLIKAQADLEALVKHKEKAREEWLEEEKKLEMKRLDEVAGQRYFRAQLEKSEEDVLSEEEAFEY